MASRHPQNGLLAIARPHRRRLICQRAFAAAYATNSPSSHTKTTRLFHAETDPEPFSRPRWAQTPQAMKAPFRSPYNPQPIYKCNNDPAVLDAAYVRVLGKDGDKILSDEVKWLAVTHKSFDQGRRGFNDRLSYLGKRIVDLQTSLALLNAPQPTAPGSAASEEAASDEYGRVPFQSPALAGLEGLTEYTKAGVLDRKRLAVVADQYGLQKVMRWHPRNPRDLKTSGVEVVLAQTLYAIVGAVSLEKGGEAANKVVRERLFSQLGL